MQEVLESSLGREGHQKIRLFAYVIIPNQERVVKKLEKNFKNSHLNVY